MKPFKFNEENGKKFMPSMRGNCVDEFGHRIHYPQISVSMEFGADN